MSGASTVARDPASATICRTSQLPAPAPCVWCRNTICPTEKPVGAVRSTAVPPAAAFAGERTALMVTVPEVGVRAASAPLP